MHKSLLPVFFLLVKKPLMILVYPYMSNGSVASCLRGKNLNIFSWICLFWFHACLDIYVSEIWSLNIRLKVQEFFAQTLKNMSYFSTNIKKNIEYGTLLSLDIFLLIRYDFLWYEKSKTKTIPKYLVGKINPHNFSFSSLNISLFNWDICVSSSSTGAIAGRFARLLASPVIALARYRTRKPHEHFFDDPEVDLRQFKRFSLPELQVASDNFSNKNFIGRGGFGKVYKGRLADGSLVAVKRLKEERTQGLKRYFQTTIEIASMTEHANLLWLLGICMTRTEMMLVYPYMSNGSVASCLRERPESQPPLDWPKRKQIALGSARGLAYLHHHCDRKIIHRDVKAANIFLDEHFEAFIGGFGLAKLMDHEDTHVDATIRGTIGHIAPEYLSTGKCSEKTDVFGYGVMLFELITGQRAFDLARLANDDDVMLLDWVKGLLTEKKWGTFVDPDLRGNYIDEEVEQLVQLALLCTQGSPTDRPKMSEVVMMLESDGLAERWEDWQNEEMFRQDEFNHSYQPNTDWIITDDIILPVELSGPR
ncbi:hypothetical protein ACJIZ3_023270 [Penstemon smallii]|uniref:non-specific serine/threonine protein kinase n=1 Tax=Penstemon smallii TaxID=265156 RepID=A0ABD3TNN9_9LAMI